MSTVRAAKYIVGHVVDNYVMPIGFSKTYKYALEIAKRHKAKVFRLTEIKDYTKGV